MVTAKKESGNMPAFRPNFTKMGQNSSDHNKDNYYYFCPIIQTIKL